MKIPTSVTSGTSLTDINKGEYFDINITMPVNTDKIDTSGLDPRYHSYRCTVLEFVKWQITVEE